MTMPAAPYDPDVDRSANDQPGFDRRRLDPDRVPRVLELTRAMCAVNDELAVRRRRSRTDRWSPLPTEPEELAARRRLLLEELHRLIAS